MSKHNIIFAIRLATFVRRPIRAYPEVKFNPGFFFLCLKAVSRIIFTVIFKAFNNQHEDKKELKLKWFLSFHIWIQISH